MDKGSPPSYWANTAPQPSAPSIIIESAPPQPQPPPPPTIVNISTVPNYKGSCPVCHTGRFTGTFPCCAWVWCILCFPCGIICCCCMRKKRCNHCGFSPS